MTILKDFKPKIPTTTYTGNAAGLPWPLLIPAGLVIVMVLALVATGSAPLTAVATNALCSLVLVLGLYIFTGNSGVVSLGQMAFMGIGAYVSAILTIPPALKGRLLPALPPGIAAMELNFFTATAVAGAVAAVLAATVGPVLMRLSGMAAGIATLAILLAVQIVIGEAEGITGGQRTLIGIPTDLTLWLALALSLAAMTIAYLYQSSPWGLRLKAARDDVLAAQSLGISVAKERTIAFVISAFVTGVAGSMLAHHQGALSPTNEFFVTPTFFVLAMLVIGGQRSLAGAVVGTVLVETVTEVFRQTTLGIDVGGFVFSAPPGIEGIVIGTILLIVLIFKRDGLTGNREFRFRRAMKRKAHS